MCFLSKSTPRTYYLTDLLYIFKHIIFYHNGSQNFEHHIILRLRFRDFIQI